MHIARVISISVLIAACGLAAGCQLTRSNHQPHANVGAAGSGATASEAGAGEPAGSATAGGTPSGSASSDPPEMHSIASVVPSEVIPSEYHVQPGDLLTVSVWKEQDLTSEVLVRPDGGLSFPLVGDIAASGKTVAALRQEFTHRLERYIPNPVVTVSTKAIGGNHIYVVGKVLKPGEYPFSRPVDAMQALSLAGGTTSFAALNDIVILRRDNGQLRSIPFHYGEVEHGRNLGQDILLQSGDTVVVP